MFKYGRSKSQVHDFILSSSHPSNPSRSTTTSTNNKVHPIFRPVTISSSVPLLEMDYNLHKSNSTYFSDLDQSRTAIVTSLLTPALGQNTMVASHGLKRGLLYPILGSVHVSFLKELKPYERYQVRSRILGWDRKWLIIGSYFVRPATKAEKAKARKEGREMPQEVLLACALNKYVIKLGRRTISPEACFAGSGWFKVRSNVDGSPLDGSNALATGLASEVPTGSNTPTPTPMPDGKVVAAADTAQNIARRLSVGGIEQAEHKESENQENHDSTDDDLELGGWTWDDIDQERKRGLEIAERWLGLDATLREEYERDVDVGLV